MTKSKTLKKERSEICLKNFKRFCETYFQAMFSRPWTENQMMVLNYIDHCVKSGKWLGLNMPRGEGQTSLLIAASIFILLKGNHFRLGFESYTYKTEVDFIKVVKKHFACNTELREDFQEILDADIGRREKVFIFPEHNRECCVLEAATYQNLDNYDFLISDVKFGLIRNKRTEGMRHG